MEYFAIYSPSAECTDADEMVFESKDTALQVFKKYKDARFKAFKSRGEALKFARNESANPVASMLDSIMKSPPPNLPPMRSLEKSNFPSLKSQDLVNFRKEIEQDHVPKVYELIMKNPRYLVSSGDTPSILKEGPRYNALHVAAMNKHAKMAKLILQTVEQISFIELLHGFKDDPNIEEMSRFLLESYLNTPDKSRNETPLHFAAKVGAIGVIEVLISYPLCKMKPNFEGNYPKDVICTRAPDTSPEVKKAIEALLNERFFVPVLRSNDSSIQPSIGEPFTPANMPKFTHDPLSPSLEIKAYAGPMTSEQAQSFRKRWKTPPRLTPSSIPSNLNISFSPKSSAVSSPVTSYNPRMSKSLTEIVSSTPKHKKQLFQDGEDSFLDNVNGDSNGNHQVVANGILDSHEEDEFKELYDDLQEEKIRMEEEKAEKENFFRGYRNPQPILDTPVRAKNDSNSNHLNHNYNQFMNSNDSMFCNPRSGSAGALMTYLDESGSVYNSDNVCDSPSFKEKHIRLTDMDKGLEKIGRDLASEHKVGWKEYWEFLGRFLDIRSEDGLVCFEAFLKQKEKLKLNESPEIMHSLSPVKNDSFGLGEICAGFDNMALNDDKSSKLTRNCLASPSSFMTRLTMLSDFASASKSAQNTQPVKNPYTCIEQSCRTFSKRLANLLESENIQDQHSFEKLLLQEIGKLNTTIDSYKRDARFITANFQKIHARYCFLLVWYLKRNNVNVKYLRNFTSLISKVYALASQFAGPNSFDPKDVIKSHAVCLSSFISSYIERQDKIFNPENIDTETACVDAWNGPDIVECQCSFKVNMTSSKHRREIRKKLYNEKSKRGSFQKIDLWAHRITQMSDDEDLYLSCSEDESDSEEFFTPPQSPVPASESDDDMNAFEESLENLEDEKMFSMFIEGEEPTKTDRDVFNAIGEKFTVDETKYPLVAKWFNSMKLLNTKSYQDSLKNNFRIFTPKLKLKSGIFHS